MACPVCGDTLEWPHTVACCEAHRRVWVRWRRARDDARRDQQRREAA